MFNYEFSLGRVYEFHNLKDANAFAAMFGARFLYSVLAPNDRYILVIE